MAAECFFLVFGHLLENTACKILLGDEGCKGVIEMDKRQKDPNYEDWREHPRCNGDCAACDFWIIDDTAISSARTPAYTESLWSNESTESDENPGA